jgi:glycerol-3-phosphate dehydrogenase
MDLRESRSRTAAQLAAGPLDVLVVGGGIVGAGIARDAALRGLRVGLVEQYDLAFGTSSRSSRLLHGGLRYLAQGRIGLVWEASREKCVLHRIAPHLVDPLPFLFPTYRGTSWPLWKLRVGVKLYDLLCGRGNLGPSGSMSRRQVLDRIPGLCPEKLTGAVRYYDGLTSDARLVIDTLRSAAAGGAMIANYVRWERADPIASGWRSAVRDLPAGRAFAIESRTVVNATGPWAENPPQSSVRLRATKGVHLVIDRGRLPVPDAVVMAEGGRILFAIPWGKRVILGTTDTDYDGSPESVRTEPADVEYILAVVNQAFPSVRLSVDDVRSTWAGLRPLIADPHGGPSDISRAHEIRMPKPGWLDVSGGKLTTYRLIAEQAVDRLLGHLRQSALPCRTADEPLVPREELPGASGILPPAPSQAVVEHYCAREWAVHLDDVLIRRSGWRYYEEDAAPLTGRVAEWMGDFLGWNEAQRQAEVDRYRLLPP